jgi:hypothetical protein
MKLNGNKKRRLRAPCSKHKNPAAAIAAHGWGLCLRDLALLQDEAQLPFDQFHLILEPQLQLLQSHFFQLFVFCQVAF